MKQYLTHLIAWLKRSNRARPVVPPTNFVRLGLEALETRSVPSTFRGVLLSSAPLPELVQPTVAVYSTGDVNGDGIPDIVVGATGAPGGHVKS